MRLSEQPGRVLAVCLLSPMFVIMGILLKNTTIYTHLIANSLIIFGIIFCMYELLWLCKPAKFVEI